MAVNARLRAFVLECPEPEKLARFYADLTGWSIDRVEDDWVALQTPAGPELSFQLAPGYAPPSWPDPASSMQYHLDFQVDDLEAAEREALALGATKFEYQPAETCLVFADPVGHPFCLFR